MGKIMTMFVVMSVVATAQDWQQRDSIAWDKAITGAGYRLWSVTEDGKVERGELPWRQSPEGRAMMLMVSFWNEYLEECRNDSTLLVWWGPHYGDTDEFGNTWAYGNLRHQRWIHRTPTAEGFMLFLEARIFR